MLVKRLIIVALLIFLVSFSAAADEIVLSNGESYKGELLNDSIKVKTEYAEFNLDSNYLVRVEKREANFYLKLKDNNHYQADILTDLRFKSSATTLSLAPAELRSLSLSSTNNYDSSHDLSIITINEDFFIANFVEESIRLKTDLEAAIEVRLKNILSIERLEADQFKFRLRDGRELEAQFARDKIIIWPAAAEIIEFDLDYLQKMNFNGS